METYNIIIEPQAEEAMMNVSDYIASFLKSPQAAANTLHALKKGIRSLDFMPQRYAVLPEVFLEKEGIRRMKVKNFYIYFQINEDVKVVDILDVLYVGREQKEKFETDEE